MEPQLDDQQQQLFPLVLRLILVARANKELSQPFQKKLSPDFRLLRSEVSQDQLSDCSDHLTIISQKTTFTCLGVRQLQVCAGCCVCTVTAHWKGCCQARWRRENHLSQCPQNASWAVTVIQHLKPEVKGNFKKNLPPQEKRQITTLEAWTVRSGRSPSHLAFPAAPLSWTELQQPEWHWTWRCITAPFSKCFSVLSCQIFSLAKCQFLMTTGKKTKNMSEPYLTITPI